MNARVGVGPGSGVPDRGDGFRRSRLGRRAMTGLVRFGPEELAAAAPGNPPRGRRLPPAPPGCVRAAAALLFRDVSRPPSRGHWRCCSRLPPARLCRPARDLSPHVPDRCLDRGDGRNLHPRRETLPAADGRRARWSPTRSCSGDTSECRFSLGGWICSSSLSGSSFCPSRSTSSPGSSEGSPLRPRRACRIPRAGVFTQPCMGSLLSSANPSDRSALLVAGR